MQLQVCVPYLVNPDPAMCCPPLPFLSCCSLAGLPAGTQASDLLSGAGKKSMLKEGAAWKTGPIRTCEARHLDEGTMKLQMQVSSTAWCAGNSPWSHSCNSGAAAMSRPAGLRLRHTSCRIDVAFIYVTCAAQKVSHNISYIFVSTVVDLLQQWHDESAGALLAVYHRTTALLLLLGCT